MAHQPSKPQPHRPAQAQPGQRSQADREADRESDRDEREAEREAERDERQASRQPPPSAAEGPDQGEDPQAAATPPVVTVVDEQRARSAEIQAMGVENWKAAHDERDPEAKPQTVAGVSTHGDAKSLEAGGTWAGSTRSTPPARAAQNPAASR
jgi:hypothetical protein